MKENTDDGKEIFPVSPQKTYGLMAVVKGTSPLADKEPENTVFTYPNLLLKEIIVFLILTSCLVCISLVFDAPLEELANPSKTPNPAKAPWYFLSLQEMLHYFSPFVAGVLIPGAVVTLLMALPYIDINPHGTGEWFSKKRKTAVSFFALFVCTVVVLTVIGLYFRGPGWTWVWPWQATNVH